MSIALFVQLHIVHTIQCVLLFVLISVSFVLNYNCWLFFGIYLFTKLHITNYGKFFAYIHVQSRNKVRILEKKVKIVFVLDFIKY